MIDTEEFKQAVKSAILRRCNKSDVGTYEIVEKILNYVKSFQLFEIFDMVMPCDECPFGNDCKYHSHSGCYTYLNDTYIGKAEKFIKEEKEKWQNT